MSKFHNEHLKKCCSSSFSDRSEIFVTITESHTIVTTKRVITDQEYVDYCTNGVLVLSEFSKMTIVAGVTIISSRLKKKNFQIYSRKTKSTMNGKRRRRMLQFPKKSLNQPATLKVLLKTPKSIFHYGLV